MSAFFAMVQRDLVVTKRNFWNFAYRVAMLPLVFIFVFGFVLPNIGQVPDTFPTLMFGGVLAMSVMVAGLHGVGIPLILDFGVSREIEDRLLAPAGPATVAYAKMVIGVLEAWLGGLIVLPLAWAIMGADLTVRLENLAYAVPVLLLAGLTSASLGLLLGTIFKPSQIPAMFPGFLIPMVLLGPTFFAWPSLENLRWVQMLVLVNPLVYVSEAFRAILTPEVPHMALGYSLLGTAVSTMVMAWVGIRRFIRMAIQ
ncbi:MAG: ABC transporter permease [Acidimicrobiia bacterium]